MLFNLLPLGKVNRRQGINFHRYADDTQLYIAASPEDPGQVDTLFKCVLGIKCWTANNFLQLDQDKTQVLREKLNAILEAASLNPCQQVKNLGVVVDADLSFVTHISDATKKAFYHLKDISISFSLRPMQTIVTLFFLVSLRRIFYTLYVPPQPEATQW